MPTRTSARSSALGKRGSADPVPSGEQRQSEPDAMPRDELRRELPVPLRSKRQKQLDAGQRLDIPQIEQEPSRFAATSLAVLALTALANAADERHRDRCQPLASMARAPALAVPVTPPADVLLHAVERPYICESCGASFALKGSLKKHTRGVHTGSKPYLCDICGRTFSQSSNLNVHRRLHQDDRPHECTMCGARFAQSGTLSKHIRVHTGEKVRYIEYCKRTQTQCAHPHHIATCTTISAAIFMSALRRQVLPEGESQCALFTAARSSSSAIVTRRLGAGAGHGDRARIQPHRAVRTLKDGREKKDEVGSSVMMAG
jgi:uncharacterized Zn-finger protein